MAKRYILLDRDGTIIVEKNYLASAKEVELLPNAGAGLRMMRAMGFGLAIVTNQSGIGRGYFTQEAVNSVHSRLRELLAEEDVALDGIYICPHAPEAGCDCRKPGPGLVWQAAAELGFGPEEAIVIGDKACDIELGQRIQAKTVLVKTGWGEKYASAAGMAPPDWVAADLKQAAELISYSGYHGSPFLARR